jgi:hypothetical protein
MNFFNWLGKVIFVLMLTFSALVIAAVLFPSNFITLITFLLGVAG